MSKVTELPTIEALSVLAFIVYTSFALVFVSTKVGFVASLPLVYQFAFTFLLSQVRSSNILGLSHISLSIRLIDDKAIILKLNMSCNIIKSLDVVIVSKVYV